MVKDARSQPPIAMRIVRPYATEDELLAHEASAFSRTGVVLLGAPSRPNGVVLRFELALTDGSSVMRGEGRVVGFKPPMANEEGALMLRFTRLDVKSKSLLDRAVTIREERRSLAPLPGKGGPGPQPQGPSPSRPPALPSSRPPSGGPAPIASRAAEPSPPAPIAAVSVRPPMPSVAPVLAGATQDEELDDADVEEVADADLEETEAEPTVQAPPVAMLEAFAAQAGGPKPPEHAPPPAPSPAAVPAPHPVAPPEHAPPTRSPEHAPGPKIAPEQAPPPQRSPEPARRLEEQPRSAAAEPEARASASQLQPRPSLDPQTRASALERLRARAKRLVEMQSMYPVGDRSSGPNGAPRASMEPGHTPVLGSLVAERDK